MYMYIQPIVTLVTPLDTIKLKLCILMYLILRVSAILRTAVKYHHKKIRQTLPFILRMARYLKSLPPADTKMLRLLW